MEKIEYRQQSVESINPRLIRDSDNVQKQMDKYLMELVYG